AGKWFRARAGFRRRRTRQRRDHDRSGFRLPPGVDDRATLFANHTVIPHPRFGIDWLAYRSEQTKRRQIMFERPLLAPFDERPNRGRRRVENVDAVTLDDVPEAIRFRP